MQIVSHTKKQTRWEPPAKVKLRSGQEDLYKLLASTVKNQYCIQLPTGYGKSWCACIAYATLRSQGRVNRVLIVVPTDQQRSQYVEGLREDLSVLEIPFTKIQRCDNKAGWVIKESHTNSSEIFVAGVQSIAADPGYYADLMSKGRWLVVADEFHHYGEDKTWGEAIKKLPYEVILGMSATPFRADNQPTIFGAVKFDVQVSVKQAFAEGAIKQIEAWIGDYAISYSTQDDPNQYERVLMSELPERMGTETDISVYEIKKGVRYSTKYISTIFFQVLGLWNEYEARWPGQNQILVFAMSCRHAELLTTLINSVAFPGYPQPFADWIGVGEGISGARSDKENADVLARFQDNKLPCLVQINKAGEGFNNKRCSIGLFLDLVGDTPMKRQHIGRFMRVNPQAPGQSSVIFVSEDSPARAVLEDIESMMIDNVEEGMETNGENNKKRSTKERSIVIPDIFILDTEFMAERVTYPFGTLEESIKAVTSSMPESVKNAYADIASSNGMTEEKAKALLEAHLAELLKQKTTVEPAQTEEEKRVAVRLQVERNAGSVAYAVALKRYGSSMPKDAVGDFKRRIQSRAKRELGPQSEMTTEDLLMKNKWLQELKETIETKGIPTWLDL